MPLPDDPDNPWRPVDTMLWPTMGEGPRIREKRPAIQTMTDKFSDDEFSGYTPSGPDPEDYAEWEAQQPGPPIDAMIECVLCEFDFGVVRKIMRQLNIRSPSGVMLPSMKQLMDEVQGLLFDAVKEYQTRHENVDVMVAGWRIEVKPTQVVLSFEVTSATVPNCVRS